jgi:hypothetical protein
VLVEEGGDEGACGVGFEVRVEGGGGEERAGEGAVLELLVFRDGIGVGWGGGLRTSLGMAMNMNSLPGQMCRWLGDIKNLEFKLASGAVVLGWIRNSHHMASMYSCW